MEEVWGSGEELRSLMSDLSLKKKMTTSAYGWPVGTLYHTIVMSCLCFAKPFSNEVSGNLFLGWIATIFWRGVPSEGGGRLKSRLVLWPLVLSRKSFQGG